MVVCAKTHRKDGVEIGLNPDPKTISLGSDFGRIVRRRLSGARETGKRDSQGH